MRWLQARLWNRRWLAVSVITVIMLLAVFVPVSLAVISIVKNADEMVAWASTLQTFQLPPPPSWVAGVPFVGERIAEVWQQVASEGFAEAEKCAKPYINAVLGWVAGRAGSVGAVLLQVLATVIIAAVMYAYGEPGAAGMLAFGRRLAGQRGENMVLLAGPRGARRGARRGGDGDRAVGVQRHRARHRRHAVRHAAHRRHVLTCIAQVGPAPVLLPRSLAVLEGPYGWATSLVVCTIVVMTLDNVLRPILIRKGADLPLLLIFAGVIGGLLTFGLIGIFVGPVVLAVTYTLLEQWVLEEEKQQSADGS